MKWLSALALTFLSFSAASECATNLKSAQALLKTTLNVSSSSLSEDKNAPGFHGRQTTVSLLEKDGQLHMQVSLDRQSFGTFPAEVCQNGRAITASVKGGMLYGGDKKYNMSLASPGKILINGPSISSVFEPAAVR